MELISVLPSVSPDVPETYKEIARKNLGTREQIYQEIDEMNKLMVLFWKMPLDDVMQHVSMISARATEMQTYLQRIESSDREYKQIRTLQLDRIIDECDRQFKIASRRWTTSSPIS